MTTPTQESVQDFAARLSDAYSTNRYAGGWVPSIKLLRRKGFTDREIEAILRSKWTRWAQDDSSARYGRVTSMDLWRFLEKYKWGRGSKQLAELVEGYDW